VSVVPSVTFVDFNGEGLTELLICVFPLYNKIFFTCGEILADVLWNGLFESLIWIEFLVSEVTQFTIFKRFLNVLV
jgi:hypothetical protein